MSALARRLIGDECRDFFRLRIDTDDIDEDAADILLVRTEHGRGDTQAMEALIDGRVDVVELFSLRTLVDQTLGDDDDLRRDAEDIKAGQQEGCAAIG